MSNWTSRLFLRLCTERLGHPWDQDVPSRTWNLCSRPSSTTKSRRATLTVPSRCKISSWTTTPTLGVNGTGRTLVVASRPTSRSPMSVPTANRTGKGSVRCWAHLGLSRTEVTDAQAGDIIAITGLGELKISDTICDNSAVGSAAALR